MVLPNCFALKGTKCIVFEDGRCAGKCSFYKTEKEVEDARAAAMARIARLPIGVQFDISFKYYGMRTPWQTKKRKAADV